MQAGVISYLIAAIAFLALSGLLAAGWRLRERRSWTGAALIAAAVVSAAWAAAVAYEFAVGERTPLVSILEGLRDGAWIAVFWLALGGRRSRVPVVVAALAVALVALVVAVALEPQVVALLRLPCNPPGCDVLARLFLSVLGLALVENLYRNADPERRWGIKHLCFGVGGLFAYDVFLYADAVLVHAVSDDLMVARGATNALVVPLVAVAAARNRDWSFAVAVSRRFVFHTAALVGTGVYMLAMAVAGFYIREFGGAWGPVLQVTFLFGAVILLAVVLVSGRARSTLRVLLSKHFFSYKYDYREEWLRFLRAISDRSGGSLAERVIRAIAAIVDSPEGALWLREDNDGDFVPTAVWNLRVDAVEPADSALVRFLEEREWVIDIAGVRDDPEAYDGLELPAWVAALPRAWIVVPLVHEGRLLGFVVLGRPRAPRTLNWEDYDILTTVGRQAASTLALERAAQALAEARQFEQFNRRFAFVLHDIKNLVSQLSLMAANAEKFGDNPAFQKDMLETVRESVDKMNRLLARLHATPTPPAPITLAPLVRGLVRDPARVEIEIADEDVAVVGDRERLTTVIEQLVQNALEASPPKAPVTIRVAGDGERAVVEVIDRGPGMEPAFIRDELFRPFRSTKHAGYGIGVYECREYVREMGGRLDVESRPGAGTTMRVVLPRAGAPARLSA